MVSVVLPMHIFQEHIYSSSGVDTVVCILSVQHTYGAGPDTVKYVTLIVTVSQAVSRYRGA
jgi:hypothetical protein